MNIYFRFSFDLAKSINTCLRVKISVLRVIENNRLNLRVGFLKSQRLFRSRINFIKCWYQSWYTKVIMYSKNWYQLLILKLVYKENCYSLKISSNGFNPFISIWDISCYSWMVCFYIFLGGFVKLHIFHVKALKYLFFVSN